MGQTPVELQLLRGVQKGVEKDIQIRECADGSTPHRRPVTDTGAEVCFADCCPEGNVSDGIHKVPAESIPNIL